MTPRAAVDNDVLIKVSCYFLAEEFLLLYVESGGVGVLDSARYVVGDRLRKEVGIQDGNRARIQWSWLLQHVEELHPSPEEVALATAMEEFAIVHNLSLDGGESLLCAIAIHRGMSQIVTGDKRAIESMEVVLTESTLDLERLKESVTCFEQILCALVSTLGGEEVRLHVCAEPGVDRAASICFSCASGAVTHFDPSGLDSYITALRGTAPSLLSR